MITRFRRLFSTRMEEGHINVEDLDVCASRVSHASPRRGRLLCQLSWDEIERMAGYTTFRNVSCTCNTVLLTAWTTTQTALSLSPLGETFRVSK